MVRMAHRVKTVRMEHPVLTEKMVSMVKTASPRN